MRISVIVISLLSIGALAAPAQKQVRKASEATKVVVPAETVTTASTSTTTTTTSTVVNAATAETPATTGLIGSIDVRPSVLTQSSDNYRTENTLEVGYKFSANNSVVYDQEFHTNLFNNDPATEGLKLQAQDGYARLKLNNVAANSNESLTLSYELRAFAPTKASKRDAGFVTTVRNYAKLARKLSDKVTLTLMEIPILHAYSRAADNGKANANLENRVYLIADVQITDKLAFSMPFQWSALKYRTEVGATNSGVWSHNVWINPEVSYAITDNYSVGAAYYNDTSLMKEDLSGFQISDGLNNGVFQLVLKASL